MMSGSASEQLATHIDKEVLGTKVNNFAMLAQYREFIVELDEYLDTCGQDDVMYAIQAKIDRLNGILRAIGG